MVRNFIDIPYINRKILYINGVKIPRVRLGMEKYSVANNFLQRASDFDDDMVQFLEDTREILRHEPKTDEERELTAWIKEIMAKGSE